MKQKKLIFNFFVNRNWKKLTDSRKRAKILADNRKGHHPIETLYERASALISALAAPLAVLKEKRTKFKNLRKKWKDLIFEKLIYRGEISPL